MVTTTIDLYAPAVTLNKTVTDVNGGDVTIGDVLEYTITATNNRQDAAANVVVTDTIPANTTFVPGSLAITAGANTGTKSDAAGGTLAQVGTLVGTTTSRRATQRGSLCSSVPSA